jgi:hypothetical protein
VFTILINRLKKNEQEMKKSIYKNAFFWYITSEYLILLAKVLALSPEGGVKI